MVIFTLVVFFIMCGWFFIATIIELSKARDRFIQPEWASNSKEKARSMLAEDISSASKCVHIVSGSANEEIYDDKIVLSAFEAAIKDDKKDIRILYSKNRKSSKKLYALANTKTKFRFIPLDIMPKTHFRVVDAKCVYMEKPHDDDIDKPREFRYIKNDPLAGHIFENKFEDLIPK